MAKPLVFKRLSCSDLTIFEVTGVMGDFIEMTSSVDVPEDRVAARNVFVEGTVTFTRTKGDEGPNAIRQRTAGETTFDVQRYSHVRAGTIRMEVITDTFKYYCISHPGKRRLKGSLLQLKKNGSVKVAPGNYLFVAAGSIDIDGAHYAAPHLIDVTSKMVAITASDDAMVAQIRKD